MPQPSSSRERAAKMLASIEAFFSRENQEKRMAEIIDEVGSSPLGRRFMPSTSTTSLVVRESEVVADSKRDVKRLEARNEQLKAELDRAYDELREDSNY